MSSFYIESESGCHHKPLQLTDTILVGRGHILKVTDKSVSRNHAQLVLDSAKTKLSIKSVHTNPTFVHKLGSDKTVVLNKDEEIELCHGDRFSFLPDKLFFRVDNKHSSSDQTLYLPIDNHEVSPTQEIDLDPLDSFKSPVETSETLLLPADSVDVNSGKYADPLETVKYPIDNCDTLHIPDATLEVNSTQVIEADPLETLQIPTDTSQTLYIPTSLSDDQDIDLDPLETFKSPIDNCETLYHPIGNSDGFNSTPEIDVDPLETYKDHIDNTDTLCIDELNSTQEIEADPLETVEIPTDLRETLCIPDTVEMNSTQEIVPDNMETLKIPAETVCIPADDHDEFTSTQEIDTDPLKISKKTTETAEIPAVNSESNGIGEIEKHEIGPAMEVVLENNSCNSDSTMGTDTGGSVSSSSTHKKRKLPVWMLEDTSAIPSNKKVKSITETKTPETETKVSEKPSATSKKTRSPSNSSSTAVIERNDASITHEDSIVSGGTTSKPAPPLESKECPDSLHSSHIPEPTSSNSDITDKITDSTAAILPVCPYGADCYRKNPDHRASYSHPPRGIATTPTKICPYGSECYRKNPAHFREFSHRIKKPRAAKTKKKSVLDGASDDDGTTNSYDLKDDFLDDSGSSSESCSTEIESSDSEGWQPSQDVTDDLLAEADEFVRNPKMLRK
ncbi:hypothetical protein LOD99_15007 [Oopsacas minuta]|uniref:Aprataxin and PNK-like factor n=1 Tax=Oopsacas minuta TaxID=111878 RepID=A0AAV7KG59_9METZ|nr:hypothetical protein LOD99_15007 [Oopsacas minuta]